MQAHVEDVLLTQHQHYHAYMTAEADKRRALIDHVKALEVGTLLLGCQLAELVVRVHIAT